MNLATVRYPFTPVLKYIPLRYDNLEHWQKAEQQSVLLFSKGIMNRKNLDKMTSIIQERIRDDPENWVVCFIPAASRERTLARYNRLAVYLSRVLPCKVTLNAILNSDSDEPSHITGRMAYYRTFVYMINEFYQKKVILIDDVICTGTTFDHTGEKLMEGGALDVYGVLFALSIHPRLPLKKK